MKKLFTLILLFAAISHHTYSQTFVAGDNVMAYSTDDALWYEATVLEATSTECKIHWEGYSDEYDTWTKTYNLWKKGQPFIVGDKLHGLETDGLWYNAKVLKIDAEKKRYFIHWGGFDSQYDRWISYDSLRLPTKENYIENGNFNTSNSSSSSSSSSSTSTNSAGKSITYNLKNETGATIKYESDLGAGARSTSTLSAGGTCSMRGIVGGKLVIDGKLYKTLTESDNGARIVYK